MLTISRARNDFYSNGGRILAYGGGREGHKQSIFANSIQSAYKIIMNFSVDGNIHPVTSDLWPGAAVIQIKIHQGAILLTSSVSLSR